MSRRRALITQADVARVIRAAKQAGAAEVIVPVGEQYLIVRLKPSTDADKVLDSGKEIVL
jgi:2-C-methyl-D-erythritol 4-phosphate cytidylyltransferase